VQRQQGSKYIPAASVAPTIQLGIQTQKHTHTCVPCQNQMMA